MSKATLEEFFQPVSVQEKYQSDQLGSLIQRWNRKSLLDIDVAIVGICDIKARVDALTKVRQLLYSLYYKHNTLKIIDFGDIVSASSNDLNYVVETTAKSLAEKNIITIYLGSQDVNPMLVTKSHFSGENLNIAAITPSLTSFVERNGLQTSDNWFRFLFGLGAQRYFDDANFLAQSSPFFAYYLGQIRDDISSVEPFFRMTRHCTFDLNSIRYSDFPCGSIPMPNGFYNEELCKLAWYAGISNFISSFYFEGYNHENDQNGVGAMAYSQVLWHIISGIGNRTDENPMKSTKGFKEYYVESKLFEEHIVFYQSKRTNLFWCKLPVFDQCIPCKRTDMDLVLQGELPEIIYRFMKVL